MLKKIRQVINDHNTVKRYSTYDRTPFFEIVKPYTEGKSVIVDIGPGTDSFAQYINRTDIYLLEGNEDSFNILRKKYQNTILYHAPDNLPFDRSSVDLVHLSHLIEHLQPKELYCLIEEIDRVLKNDGILAISAPTLNPDFYNDLSHIKPYNPAVFVKYLVWKNPTCTTRQSISNKYEQVELRNRHFLRPLPNIGSKNPTIDWIVQIISLIFQKLGIGIYEKTGYTLILRKQ